MQASDPLDPRAVRGAVKAQPGNARAGRKPSATAGLDRLISRSSFVRADGRSFVPARRASIASRAGAEQAMT
jgi:hypothetical protein